MKIIVVPTDFSPAAEEATLYATHLARATGAAVRLLHMYQLPVTLNDFPVPVIPFEELKTGADNALNKAKAAALKVAPDVRFETESRMGDVVDEIEETCAGNDVFAVVTGAKSKTGFERFLLGNTTASVAKRCSQPVIVVHEGTKAAVPKKIALATDLSDVNNMPVEKIIEFVRLLKAELHVVHIELEGESSTTPALPAGLKESPYHSLKEDDVTKGVEHFVLQNNIDLLIVLPHKHTLYERLFFKGHTEELLTAVPVPVMCLR